ncbi:MAG: hypothetical protein KDB03_09330 [Planctomycetales bacterium]|nr:hypothetical protein [Planctomycetales bacterium]
MEVPSDWQRKEKPGFVEAEFSVPKDGKPEEVARITMMASGGSIKDNIERWYGQFQQADGSSTADRAKLEELKIADMKVHWVQITGSFKDSMGAGPFQRAPAVLRENYAMLGAIAETKDAGLYFFKATGPATTIDKLAPEFKEALKTLQPKK